MEQKSFPVNDESAKRSPQRLLHTPGKKLDVVGHGVRVPLYFGWELQLAVRRMRGWQQRAVRPFRTYRRYILTVGLAIAILVSIGVFSTHKKLLAATYTWVQNAWTGGATANTGVHPTNETGWTEYSAKDATVSAGATVSLALATQTVTDTSDADFNAGSQSSTSVSLTGAASMVQLSVTEGGTPTFVQYAAYGNYYEYDGATNSVWVSGTNQTLTKYAADGSSTSALATLSLTSYMSGTAQIAYDSNLGVLWAIGKSAANLNLIKIDVSTAAVISSTTLETDASSARDIRYDAANDVLWISYGWTSGSRILKVNKSGSILLTIASNTAVELAIDPGTSSIWYVDGTSTVYKQPESGAAATTISLGGSYGSTNHIIYESATPAVWATSEQYSFGGYHRILTSNNAVTSKTDAELPNGIAYDSVHDVLWTSDSLSAKVFKINRTTPAAITSYAPSNPGTSSRPFYDATTRSFWFHDGGTGLTKRMTFVSYAASGNFTSRIIDTTANTAFGNASWNIATPTNTTAAVKVRSSNSATMSGAPAFSSCSAITSGQNPTVGGCVTNGQRYVQYNVAFTTTNTAVTPTLQDLSLTYTTYTNGTLTSSVYDTQDTNNVVAKIEWGSSGSGTVQFQIRTSPDNAAWTSWLGPTSGSDYYTDNTGGQAINAANHDASGDRYVQYKAYLISADGVSTPTLSSVTLTYVVNAPPEFQAAPTAAQNADGTVTISYSVRDTDTSTDTGSVGFVTPSFEYSIDNGAHWSAISSGLPGSATTPKAVNASSYTPYSTIWTAKTPLNGTYATQTKIRVTVSDQQAANATAVGTTSAFAVDVKNPVLGVSPITIDASTIPAQLALNASDDTAFQMCISLDNTQTNCASYAASSTITLETDPDTVYVIYRDGFGNTASASVVTPTTPNNLVIRDISNQTTSEYQLFLTWAASSLPSNQFSKYEVYHSSTGQAGSYALLGNIADKTINYYLHKSLVAGSTHYYRISTVDATGNESYLSSPITDVANGQGGGTDVVPPAISNVAMSSISTQSAVVTWDTDELSNSTVGYSTTAAHFDTEVGVATMVDHAGGVGRHSVVMTGLTPNTPYYLRIKSADPGGNTATDTNGGDGYTFSTLAGPTISTVTASSIDNATATITWITNTAANSTVVFSSSPTLAAPTTITSSTAVTQHSVTLNGLTLATRYYYQVQSGVAIDTNAGQYYSFTTTHDSLAPIISGITVAPITDTQAVISWSTDEKSTGQVMYGTSIGSHPTQTLFDANHNLEHSVTISSLVPHTVYYFVVSSVDASGNSTVSPEQNFQTLYQLDEQVPGVTPPVITAVSASPVTDTQAVAQWSTDLPASSRVDYGLSAGHPTTHVGPNGQLTRHHALTLPSLTPHTTYYYTVTSTDTWGNTATSPEQTFTTQYELVEQTPSTTSPVISAISAEPIADTTAVIHWISDVPASSQVSYGVTKNSYTAASTIDASLNLNHVQTVSALLPNTTYYYVVTSTDRWGNSTTSAEQSFTTLDTLLTSSQVQTMIDAIKNQNKPDTTPPAVTGVAVQNLTSTSVDITWNTDEPANSFVQFNSTADDQLVYGNWVYEKTHRITLRNLQPKTTYTYHVVSADLQGNVTTSTGATLDTPPLSTGSLETQINNQLQNLQQEAQAIPGPVIGGQPKVDLTTNSATISWSTDKGANSLISYSTDAEYSRHQTYTQTVGDPDHFLLNHSVKISNLAENTLYHYQIKSSTQVGQKSTTPDATFQTPKKSFAIDNYSVDTPGTQSAVFRWTTNDISTALVQATPYRNNVLAVDEMLTQNDAAKSLIHQVSISTFEPGTKYKIEMVSTSTNGNRTSKTIDAFSTSVNGQPPVISQIHVDSALSPGDKVKVQSIISWTTDIPSTSQVQYGQGVGKADATLPNSSPLDASYSKHHAVVITAFDPGTVYQLRVESKSSTGLVATSKAITTLTPQQEQTVFQVITDTFQQVFGWVKIFGK